MALGVPGRFRPRIISTFGTTRVVGRQPYTPAAFTPGEIPGTHFQRLSRPQGTWFCRKEPRKKSPVTLPGIDPGTVRLVAQLLKHICVGRNNQASFVFKNEKKNTSFNTQQFKKKENYWFVVNFTNLDKTLNYILCQVNWLCVDVKTMNVQHWTQGKLSSSCHGGSSFKIVINFLRIRTETVCAVCYLCSGKFSCGSEWFWQSRKRFVNVPFCFRAENFN